ncbi:hypothetical protein GCM10010168_76210 [Actinoplanes ianthinogenes]|uniref:Carboxylesterase type B domain-containing protein n=1 Tax=Actinoplanes ianthinogenes TaxID=122358 RepID=A0ABM7MA29_9ACTN|nr:hypothetical protein Aiant_91100 [Actinoplanes ianthinogenes]GGR46260.1 hypothetical protein GCM10010168_76210 [Actinoplanes ianthinogenes]
MDTPVRTTGCGARPPATSSTRTIPSGGISRTYLLHLPDGYRAGRPTPVVLSFHGRTRTSAYQEELTQMDRLDAIVAYPQGTIGSDGEPSFQGAPYSSGADDVLFTSDLLNDLQRRLCVDPARIYVAGKSNGGGFAGLLACRMAGRIAASAQVSGAFYPQGGTCQPMRPTPILEFHGTADGTIPYDGNPAKGLPSIPSWLGAWAVRNRCSGDPVPSVPATGVTKLTWPGCAAPVEHYRIDGLGHTWPSTTPNPDSATPTVIDATPIIAKFFADHPLATRPVARTDAGTIRGVTVRGVEQFLGVRYAAAPTGALRFRDPQPVPPWTGLRDTAVLGANCPQGNRGSEDCLFLNIYRPAGTRPGDRLPVFFWIHGGGFTGGSGDDDGSALATANHMIVVTINYRLGALGFLADPALSRADGSSGNYGLLDQQAALRWVHRNAPAIGADAGKVTIGGESAGGGSVCALLASPTAAGLFRGAVIESDDCSHDVDRLSWAQQRGAAVVTAVGCGAAADVAACLRTTPAADLVAKTSYIAPNVSGRVLPMLPATAIARGRWNRVPVLIGSNREEGRSFSTFATGYDDAAYRAWLTTGPDWPPVAGTVRFGPEVAARIAEAYPITRFTGAYPAAYAIGQVLTDSGTRGLGGCTQLTVARSLARQTPTYYYQFEDPAPPRLSDTPADYDYAASHAYELAYLWRPDTASMSGAQRQLSAEMIRRWGTFVTRGVPQDWPALRPAGGSALSLRPGGASRPVPVRTVSDEHHCALWKDVLGFGPTA